jgi:integrase
MAKALTVKAVEAARGEGGVRREVPDGLIAGLYLVVQPSGSKSWAVRYRAAGQPRKLTIGAWPAIQLSDARELARRALLSVAEGADPARAKQTAKRAGGPGPERDLIERLAADFVDRYAKANTRETSWRETERILGKVLAPDADPPWRGRRVQDIGRRDVIELLDAVHDRGSPIMANRTLATIRRMFGWFVERGVIEASPCAGIRAPAAELSRDRILSDDELRAVWSASGAIGHPFGPLVRLLLLTGQRREEVTGMRWTELDLERRLWTLPRERVKNDSEHTVPLSPAAVAILEALPRIGRSPFVFTTTEKTAVSGHSRAKVRLDDEILHAARAAAAAKGRDPAEVKAWPRWTFHDLRRTAASGMARLGVQLPVIEKVLNHSSGSFAGVVGVYQRHSFADEKRAALEAWGRFVEELVRGNRADG